MSSTGVTIGYGTIVEIATITEPEFVKLAGIGDVTFPVNETEEVEVTHQESPGRAKEFIAGLTDNGEVSVPVHYVPLSPTDMLLNSIRATGETVQIRFTAANGGPPETYAGFCKRYARTAPVQGAMTAEAVFRISGIIEPESEPPVSED